MNYCEVLINQNMKIWLSMLMCGKYKFIYRKNITFYDILYLLPTGQSQVTKKFSSRSQLKTSWPPLIYYVNFILCQSGTTCSQQTFQASTCRQLPS